MGRKLGIIGAGKVGEALAVGIAQRGLVAREDILLSDRTEAHIAAFTAKTGLRAIVNNREVARLSDTIIVAVKPKDVADVITAVQRVIRWVRR
jgi:pyrroline-5-carboxylate reductase